MSFGTNYDDTRNGGDFGAFDVNSIENGWDVFDANNDKVGDVHAVNADYLTVSKGFFFPTERYIPVRDIQGIRHDRVFLRVTKDELQQEGWDQPPTAGATRTAGTGDVYGTLDREFQRDTTDTYRDYGTRAEDMTGTAQTAGTAMTGGERTVELREQELNAQAQQVKAGEVHLRKDVVTEQRTVEVPVTHEEVVIERRPIDAGEAMAGTGTIGQGEDITVPVYEEQVQLTKETRPYEEVQVNTREVQQTRQVTGEVKKEVLRVDGEGDVEVSGTGAERTDTTGRLDTFGERRRTE